MSTKHVLIGLMISVGVVIGAQQVAPPLPPNVPPMRADVPASTQIVQQAKAAAGSKWAGAVRFLCEAPRPNLPSDPAIAPTRIFDAVYAIGNTGTTAYVIRTPAGLLMIDALSANQVDSQ